MPYELPLQSYRRVGIVFTCLFLSVITLSSCTAKHRRLNKTGAADAKSVEAARTSYSVNASGLRSIAVKFAPIVYHHPEEKYYPTDVGSFLQHTRLMFFDEDLSSSPSTDCLKLKKGYGCLVEASPTNLQFHETIYSYQHTDGRTYVSDSAYDSERKKGFYLEDVKEEDKGGSKEPSGRTTYYQTYRTADNGYVIQYWFFYAFNEANAPFGLGKHGGDWEGIQVIVDSSSNPVRVRFLGHDGEHGIVEKQWAEVQKQDTHPKMYVQKGDHPSLVSGPENGTRHNTWETGNFLDLGSKLFPNQSMYFLRYAGMWGTPGDSYPLLGKINSGYWAPSYNETGKANSSDRFFPAWCNGRPPGKDWGQAEAEIRYQDGSIIRECYAPTPPG